MKEYTPKYWNGIGKHQKKYSLLFSELIPIEGKAKTERGEILRIVSRLHYDIYNNGGCNFSNFKIERVWLVNNVPHYAKDSTKEFVKSIKYGIPQSNKRMEFIDKYIDWVVLYVQALGSLDVLEKEIPEVFA